MSHSCQKLSIQFDIYGFFYFSLNQLSSSEELCSSWRSASSSMVKKDSCVLWAVLSHVNLEFVAPCPCTTSVLSLQHCIHYVALFLFCTLEIHSIRNNGVILCALISLWFLVLWVLLDLVVVVFLTKAQISLKPQSFSEVCSACLWLMNFIPFRYSTLRKKCI